MFKKLKQVFTLKRLIIIAIVFILLIPVFWISFTFYKNLSQGVENENLDDKYTKRVKELQIEVSKEDPLDQRGNSTEKTCVELEVSFNEEKPSQTELSELLTTCLLRNLKWELLGKTVLRPATIICQARRAVPALGCFGR